MAFPNILTDRPIGTQYVSTIDDFERETRTWLKQSIQEVSGYPDITTVTVLGWTEATKPSSNPTDKYLLGYNEDSQSLELVGQDGNSVDISRAFMLMAHPVGEYYWTSNENFDPNVTFGGTWERIQDGRVLISDNTSHEVGSTGGVETVTLTEQQIPSHIHWHSHYHNHDKGDMNISGYFGADDLASNYLGGAFHDRVYGYESGSQRSETGFIVYFDANRAWTGRTGVDNTGGGSYVGGSQAHNNMQPYRTAICWHRTA